MMKLKNISLLFASVVLATTSAFAQEDTTSTEKEFSYSVGGRAYMDGVYYQDDATDLSSKVTISDVRIFAKASWGKWDSKINFSFADNKVHAKDIYVNYNFTSNSALKIGNFFEPFGIQGSISSKDTRFIGNSFSGEAFGIGRSVGVSYTTYDTNYYVSGGVFGGRIGNNKQGDSGYSATIKAVYSPIVSDDMNIHIGASASYRKPAANGFDSKYNDDEYNREVVFTAGPEHTFLNGTVNHAKNELKLNVQLLGTFNRFMIQSEYYNNKVYRNSSWDLEFEHSTPDMWGWPSTPQALESWYGEKRDIEMSGYYVQAGYLIKGANYKYDSATAYVKRPGAGSIEILGRINTTNLNDIDGIFMQDKFWNGDPLKASSGQTNFSVGGGESTDYSVAVNYYINKNVLFRLNYTYMDIDNEYFRQDDSVSFVKARVQINF
ncbi:MAG: hypothetical protein JKY08_03530 [Flavobacteriaceae bacterium]|nr:hypothetical protein [Flavobacteriaceae bacterium]